MFDSFPDPKRISRSSIHLLARKVLRSAENSGATPIQQKEASGADSAFAEPRFQGQKRITIRTAEQF